MSGHLPKPMFQGPPSEISLALPSNPFIKWVSVSSPLLTTQSLYNMGVLTPPRRINSDSETTIQKLRCRNQDSETTIQKLRFRNYACETTIEKLHHRNYDLNKRIKHTGSQKGSMKANSTRIRQTPHPADGVGRGVGGYEEIKMQRGAGVIMTCGFWLRAT